MSAFPSRRFVGITVYLAAMAGALGQDTVASSPVQSTTPSTPTVQASQIQTTLQAFQTEQGVLFQSLKALLTLNPTPQQMQTWQQQNATGLASQQQLALDMAADAALQPMVLPGPPNIPAKASSTLAAFLTTQATLAIARAQIHNQLLNALPAEVSDAQISQMQQSEEQLFQQQQGANLELQGQQAQTLANESAQQPLPLPPPLSLPPGTPPRLAAFLAAKDQFVRDQIAFTNQYVTATPAVRNAATEQWMQQNAARFQQMQQLAQILSQSTTN